MSEPAEGLVVEPDRDHPGRWLLRERETGQVVRLDERRMRWLMQVAFPASLPRRDVVERRAPAQESTEPPALPGKAGLGPPAQGSLL